MAAIKQVIPCEPGWEAVYVRDDAIYDSPVKSITAPVIGWALVDDEEGNSSIQPLFNYSGAITTSSDFGDRYLGVTRAADYAAQLMDVWEGSAVGYMDDFGEPGAEFAEGGEGEEGGGEETSQ